MAARSLLLLLTFLAAAALSAASPDMSIVSYGETHPSRGLAHTDEELRLLYDGWLAQHGGGAAAASNALGEKERRFQIFKDNLRFIDEHNAGDHSFRLGLNRFADITNDEFRARFLGVRAAGRRERGAGSDRYRVAGGDELPESVDWRDKGAVAPVKDQGSCDLLILISIAPPSRKKIQESFIAPPSRKKIQESFIAPPSRKKIQESMADTRPSSSPSSKRDASPSSKRDTSPSSYPSTKRSKPSSSPSPSRPPAKPVNVRPYRNEQSAPSPDSHTAADQPAELAGSSAPSEPEKQPYAPSDCSAGGAILLRFNYFLLLLFTDLGVDFPNIFLLISGIIDTVVFLFSVVLAVAIPLIDAQSFFPELYPPALVDLKLWYRDQFGDYLMGEMPHFFVGLVWIEIALLWPLSLANVYGIAARRPWTGTTSLIAGVSAGTSMISLRAYLSHRLAVTTKLISLASALTPSMFYAHQLFDAMPLRDSFTWNTLIRGYSDKGPCRQVPILYSHIHRSGLSADHFTFPFVIRSCTVLSAIREGKQTHCNIIKTGFDTNLFVHSALVSMYSQNNQLADAELVFSEMGVRNLVSWTSMIAGYVQSCLFRKAVDVFHSMPQSHLFHSSVAMADVTRRRESTGSEALLQSLREAVHAGPRIFARGAPRIFLPSKNPKFMGRKRSKNTKTSSSASHDAATPESPDVTTAGETRTTSSYHAANKLLPPSSIYARLLQAEFLYTSACFTGERGVYADVILLCEEALKIPDPVDPFNEPNMSDEKLLKLNTPESRIEHTLQCINYLRSNAGYCAKNPVSMKSLPPPSPSSTAAPLSKRQRKVSLQQSKAIAQLKRQLGELDTISSEALTIAEAGQITFRWRCCFCNEKFTEHKTHKIHVLKVHVGLSKQNIKDLFPRIPDKDWIQRSSISGWSPLNDQQTNSSTDTLQERAKLLDLIQRFFDMLLNRGILTAGHVENMVHLAVSSEPSAVMLGADKSNECIRQLSAPHLTKILRFLEDLSEIDEDNRKDSSVDCVVQEK